MRRSSVCETDNRGGRSQDNAALLSDDDDDGGGVLRFDTRSKTDRIQLSLTKHDIKIERQTGLPSNL